MAKDYQLIQAQTLTSSAASVTFSNIPQNFTDLILKISARTNYSAVNDYIYMSLNGNTSLNSYNMIYGDGSSTAGYNGAGATNATGISTANGATSTVNTFCNSEVYIPNYASSTAKSASVDTVIENNATATVMELLSYLNTGTSAITTIALTPGNGPNFVANSTFALYGVGGARATGGTITYDFNYTYHTFTSTSTFTPLEKIKNAEVLVIAGGGASTGTVLNGYATPGGGAGGLVYSSGQTLFAGTSYTAIVGAGGAAGASGNTTRGGNGGNSQFGSVTLAVGGGGGGAQPESPSIRAGSSGGSGGGSFLAAGGAATAGQGNAGGNAASDHPYLTSGGGGAAEVGGIGAGDYISGKGGDGSSSYSQWGLTTGTGQLSGNSYYYAGGGAGGLMLVTSSRASAGGLGGGGSNTSSANGKTNGTANTGGGASGVNGYGAATAGASGGSGLVIVRYPSI
jgi:hypothetical protein